MIVLLRFLTKENLPLPAEKLLVSSIVQRVISGGTAEPEVPLGEPWEAHRATCSPARVDTLCCGTSIARTFATRVPVSPFAQSLSLVLHDMYERSSAVCCLVRSARMSSFAGGVAIAQTPLKRPQSIRNTTNTP